MQTMKFPALGGTNQQARASMAMPAGAQRGRSEMSRYTGPDSRPAGERRDGMGRPGVERLRSLVGRSAPPMADQGSARIPAPPPDYARSPMPGAVIGGSGPRLQPGEFIPAQPADARGVGALRRLIVGNRVKPSTVGGPGAPVMGGVDALRRALANGGVRSLAGSGVAYNGAMPMENAGY